jgi:hypothetical protein
LGLKRADSHQREGENESDISRGFSHERAPRLLAHHYRNGTKPTEDLRYFNSIVKREEYESAEIAMGKGFRL